MATNEQLKHELESKLEQVKAKIQSELLEIERLQGGLEVLRRLDGAPVHVRPLTPSTPVPEPVVQAYVPVSRGIPQVPSPLEAATHTTPYLAAKANRIASKGKILK